MEKNYTKLTHMQTGQNSDREQHLKHLISALLSGLTVLGWLLVIKKI